MKKITVFILTILILLTLSACDTDKEQAIQGYKDHVTGILEEEGSVFKKNKRSLKGDLLKDGPIPQGLVHADILSQDTETPRLLMVEAVDGEDELPTQLYLSFNSYSDNDLRVLEHITENTAYDSDDYYILHISYKNVGDDRYILWQSDIVKDVGTNEESNMTRQKVFALTDSKLKEVVNISINDSDVPGVDANIYSLNGNPLDQNLVVPKDPDRKQIADINSKFIQAEKDCVEELKKALAEYGLEDTIDERGYPIIENNNDDFRIAYMVIDKGAYKIKTYKRPQELLER